MSSQPETVSLYKFFQRFPGEEAARAYFEENRWLAKLFARIVAAFQLRRSRA